jgi:tetratricopeptide (TPR) repeat protein
VIKNSSEIAQRKTAMFSITKTHSYFGNHSIRQNIPHRRIHFHSQQSVKASRVFSKTTFGGTTTSTVQLPTVRSLSTQRTINSQEELKQAVEKGNFEKVDQAARELKRSPQGQESIFFLGKELYEKTHRDFEARRKEGFSKEKERVLKQSLYRAEECLISCTRKEARELLARVYCLLGQISASKNSYEAVFYYQQALKNLVSKQIRLPDFEWDGGPVEIFHDAHSTLLAQINAALGNAAILEGDMTAAKRYLDKALEQDGKNVEALVLRGCIAIVQEGLSAGTKYLDRAFATHRAEASKMVTDAIFYLFPHAFFRAETGKKEVCLQAPLVYPDAIANYSESVKNYNHFLNTDPDLRKANLQVCQKVFKAIHEGIESAQLRDALTAEILLKEVAFYAPKLGTELSLPALHSHEEMRPYKIDKILTLGGKIPAYGLTTPHPEAPPILVFRGTAPALSREGGLASVIEDFDSQGVAKRIFDEALPRIQDWLARVTQANKQARILGYSQGAALAALTAVHCRSHVSKKPHFPSITFNPPGIDPASLEKWKKIVVKERPVLLQYLVEGDLVSRCGSGLIGEAYEIATAEKLAVLDAHLTIVLPQHHWKMFKVNIEKDNQAVLRQFAAGFVESDYGVKLYEFLKTNSYVNLLMTINGLASNAQIGQGINRAAKLAGLVTTLLNPVTSKQPTTSLKA